MAAQSQTARELPLKELLALYGYAVSDPEKQSCHVAASLPGMTLDKGHVTEELFPRDEEEGSSADDLDPSVTSNTSALLRRLQGGDKDTLVSSSDEDSDASVPSNEEHKEIMVGSMYQAKIPPISPYTYEERAYSSEDQLLWRPGVLPVQEVEDFLLSAQRPHIQEGGACKQKQGAAPRDNEQALYELVKCNFNAEEALRRLRFNVKVFHEELCAWSEEECRNFEHGYRVYGKNFHLIQANKVRTRSVGECVEYYYMWKKSDRHEYFTQQATTRLSRKKYNLQSGSMDDGDQDVEAGELEQSNNLPSLLSHGSIRPRKLESALPPQSSLDLDKQGGGPTPSQTNSPLSLKAMTSVQTGHRKQAGPADGELATGPTGPPEPRGDRRPRQLFGRPFPPPPILDLPGAAAATASHRGQLRSQPSTRSPQRAREDPPSRRVADGPLPPGARFIRLRACDGPFVPRGPAASPSAGCGWGSARWAPRLPHLLSSRHLAPCCAPPAVQYPHSLTQ